MITGKQPARPWPALLCPLLLAAAGCSGMPQHYALGDFATVAKIDVHVHIDSMEPTLLEQAAADGFRLLTINVDYPDFPSLAEQAAIARAQVAAQPQRLAWAATFSMDGWDTPGWAERVQQQLAAAFADGAVAVKVWKNIGMSFRDRAGRLVMIDDPRFDGVFDFVRTRGKVLIGHQGEPYNCWLPLEQMSVSGDREYFREHPQYHMYLHPELPSYARQMAARDAMLERNPQLSFMGAHMASLEWSVSELARFLDRHPRAVVDMAARMGQVQYQSQRDRGAVRRFFIRYQDRLLYGTDLTQEPGADAVQFRREAHEVWLRDWQYLNLDGTQTVPDLAGPVRGLALPRSVVHKIYSANAERTFAGAWRAQPEH